MNEQRKNSQSSRDMRFFHEKGRNAYGAELRKKLKLLNITKMQD